MVISIGSKVPNSIRVFPKQWYPQIIHFNRVFHYFHHPFWGTTIFGSIHKKQSDFHLEKKNQPKKKTSSMSNGPKPLSTTTTPFCKSLFHSKKTTTNQPTSTTLCFFSISLQQILAFVCFFSPAKTKQISRKKTSTPPSKPICARV